MEKEKNQNDCPPEFLLKLYKEEISKLLWDGLFSFTKEGVRIGDVIYDNPKKLLSPGNLEVLEILNKNGEIFDEETHRIAAQEAVIQLNIENKLEEINNKDYGFTEMSGDMTSVNIQMDFYKKFKGEKFAPDENIHILLENQDASSQDQKDFILEHEYRMDIAVAETIMNKEDYIDYLRNDFATDIIRDLIEIRIEEGRNIGNLYKFKHVYQEYKKENCEEINENLMKQLNEALLRESIQNANKVEFFDIKIKTPEIIKDYRDNLIKETFDLIKSGNRKNDDELNHNLELLLGEDFLDPSIPSDPQNIQKNIDNFIQKYQEDINLQRTKASIETNPFEEIDIDFGRDMERNLPASQKNKELEIV